MSSLGLTGPIAESHSRSLAALGQLCETAKRHDTGQRDPAWLHGLVEELDKYKLWAGNLGAGNPNYKLSLDGRLEDASFYRDQVLGLLKILRRHVGRTLRILEQNQLASELCWDSDDSTGSLDLGGDDQDDISLGASTDSDSGLEADDPSIDIPEVSEYKELESLLQSIKLAVNCLCQLPIRKPAPVDRLRDKSVEDIEFYEFYDVKYVRDKFPNLDERVALSLGKMVTRRRQLLRYRESHARHLKRTSGHASRVARTPLPPTVVEGDNKSMLQVGGVKSLAGNSSRTGGSRSEATKWVPEPTQLHENNTLAAQPNADAESTTSESASEFTQESPAEPPPRPHNEKGQPLSSFECAYCKLIVFQDTPRSWKKHVFEDLQPYCCTFAECDLSGHFFESRHAWFTHEMHRHRVEFFCNVQGHDVYKTREAFLQHLRQAHEPATKTAATLPELFRRPSKDLTSSCNLCGQTTHQLKAHLSRHLQHIALFAIPRSHHHSDFDANENDSRAVQQFGTDHSSKKNSEKISLYSRSEAEESNEGSMIGQGSQQTQYYPDGRVDAPYPRPSAPPPPPSWLVKRVQELQQKQKDSSFEPIMLYLAIQKDTNTPTQLHHLPPNAQPPPIVKFMWLPHVSCTDCPGQLYSLSPDSSNEEFESHLKASAHVDAVHARLRWQKILNWLSPNDYLKAHENKSREVNLESCRGILEQTQILSWINRETRTLCCEGMVSSGKSVLANTVINYLISMKTGNNDESRNKVAFLYLTAEEQSSTNRLLGSLTRQLIDRYSLPRSTRQLLEALIPKSNEFSRTPELPQLVSLLSDLVRSSAGNIFFVVDGLDKIIQDDSLRLLSTLLQIENVSVLFTSRPFSRLREFLPLGCERLQIQVLPSQIEQFIEERIGKTLWLKTILEDQPRLRKELTSTVRDRSSGMFLWVHLSIAYLDGVSAYARANIWHALDQLPQTVEDSYLTAVKRITQQEEPKREWAMWTFARLILARRPLSLHDLLQVLPLADVILEPPESFRRSKSLRTEDVEPICHGLVKVQDKVFSLVHESVRDFLEADEKFLEFNIKMSEFLAVDKTLLALKKELDEQDEKGHDSHHTETSDPIVGQSMLENDTAVEILSKSRSEDASLGNKDLTQIEKKEDASVDHDKDSKHPRGVESPSTQQGNTQLLREADTDRNIQDSYRSTSTSKSSSTRVRRSESRGSDLGTALFEVGDQVSYLNGGNALDVRKGFKVIGASQNGKGKVVYNLVKGVQRINRVPENYLRLN